jgi:hypothetical protein
MYYMIRPYYCEENNQAVNVYSERHWRRKYFRLRNLQERGKVWEMCGTLAQKAREGMSSLSGIFLGRLISRFGDTP